MDNKTFLESVSAAAELDLQSCSLLLEKFTDILEDAISSGDSVSIPSFGNFESKKRNERVMSHPSSPGTKILVPPKVVVNFKASPILKERVNKG
ncbi:MAG: HU family DNA-binding protein [Muribaculaceae bacterium]|nr:HU family DNA-binding protein [Muribaculaceae bacterium]